MSLNKSIVEDTALEWIGEQLQRIREIRLSERKFYQKITDIYATSIDYDITAAATKRFFATVQNKLHWAIHGQTAANAAVTPKSYLYRQPLACPRIERIFPLGYGLYLRSEFRNLCR